MTNPEDGSTSPVFPFDAVVGHDDAKLALRLAALDPLIGGVLLRGEKGSAKTTLARGLAAELGAAPFVELPLGATEDRLVGTIDTRAALTGGEIRFQPGLLAAADGGVLYVDEINLLADHLVDVLLDVAVSGENVVERDGVSHRHPARFVLVGSMNPEEGELRPQLLDRFGLCVSVTAPRDVEDRVEAVLRRLRFDQGELTGGASGEWDRSAATDASSIDREMVEAASRLALGVGAEGLRADLTLCRAAAALAAGEQRAAPTVEDLRRVAPLVLAHRGRRHPFDPPIVPPETLEAAMDGALADAPTDPSPSADDGPDDPAANAGVDDRPLVMGTQRRPPPTAAGLPNRAPAARGRQVGDRPAGPGDAIAVVPTVRAMTRTPGESGPLDERDLRTSVRQELRGRTIVVCVDLSGSMGAPERAAAASGTVLGLLTTAYEQRHAVALVTFRGDGAEVVIEPTTSVEVARNRLGDLQTGGTTPLAAGLTAGFEVATRAARGDRESLLVVLTDGRASGDYGVEEALGVARRIAGSGTDSLVLDCETGATRLGLARDLADALGAGHAHVDDLDPVVIGSVVQNHLRAR